MEKFNTYYPIILMSSIFIFYPINHLLGTLNISSIQSMAIVAPLILIGIIHMILAYKDSIELFVHKIPMFTLFVITGTILIISESYIFGTASYVPEKTLKANNIYWVSFILTGILFAFYLKYILNTIKRDIKVLFIVSSLWIVILIVFTIHFSFVDFLRRTFLGEDSSIDFQTLSDFAVIAVYLLIAKFFKNNFLLLLVSIFILIEIFLLGSRSTILLFVVSILALLIKQGKFVFLFSAASIILVLLAIFFNDLVQYYADDYRVMTILGGHFEKDLSLQERAHQLHNNLKYIDKNWFTGNIYGEYLGEGVGSYIHNYLSYLQNFGIVPFIFLNLLILKLLYSLVIYIVDSFEFRYIFLITLFTIGSMFISRSYDATWVLLSLSMSEAYFYMLRKGEFDENITH